MYYNILKKLYFGEMQNRTEEEKVDERSEI